METKYDDRYVNQMNAILQKVETEQATALKNAAEKMADAIEKDTLIYLFGGGGHTCLVMQELFWRAGGLANICPMIDFAIHPVTPAYMYLGHERMHGIGNHIVNYYGVAKDDIIIIFYSYGFNPPTIDCALEAKKRGATVIGISSSDWRANYPKNFAIRHNSGKHLFDIADICIDNYVPYGDTVIEVKGLEKPVSGISSIIDFYIAHRLEMESIKESVQRGITPPVWSSANVPGGDEYNESMRKKYSPRVKFL